MAGQTYTYHVVAKNSTGNNPSNTITVTVPSDVCPLVPSPSIARVNPDPVNGINAQQSFTIIGNNFDSGATVTLRDLDAVPIKVFPNRAISSLGPTQIVINPNFTVASHLWDVQVINPGGVPSNQYQFNVVSPDLVVENVTFNPASVIAGGTLMISFDVRNIGSGKASPTQARLRLSLDNSLTSSDLPLSPLDVNIDPIAAGASTPFSQLITVPNSTPANSYFVGVFADWDNRGNQSDVTNDAGLSPPSNKLTVTATGVSRPTITLQPQSQPVSECEDVTLRVEVSGSNPKFQWFRNESRISDAVSSSLVLKKVSTTQAGNYQVAVSNSGGFVLSNIATLTVSPSGCFKPTTTTQLSGRLTGTVQVNPPLPTIVITHGWQLKEFYTGSPPEWVTKGEEPLGMKETILARLTASDVDANVLTYEWPGAFTGDNFLAALALTQNPVIALREAYKAARADVYDAGTRLAADLEQALGSAYSQNIHFIGHSFGSFVNAQAVSHLSDQFGGKIQFTILDGPTNFVPWDNEDFFNERLPLGKVQWVDNYYGDDLFAIPPAVGEVVSKAANCKFPGNDHSEVHDSYLGTVSGSSNSSCANQGFNFSIVLGDEGSYGSRPSPMIWIPKVQARSILSFLPASLDEGAAEVGRSYIELFRTTVGTAQKIQKSVKGQITDALRWLESSPSEIEADITIPIDAKFLTFDVQFPNAGDGDRLTVLFNGAPLLNLNGEALPGLDFEEVEVPLGELAGQTGILTIRLNSTGLSNAEILAANFRFIASESTSFNVSIAAPTTNPTYISTVSPIILSGTAVNSAQVSWVNDRGGSGIASGTTNWNVSAIELQPGDNVITVTASDAANNTSIDTLTVTYNPLDTTPPAAVTDLATGTAATTSVALSWPAPGDDGNSGTATSYDIRYALSQITENNWASATQVSGAPVPLVAGSPQNFTVPGLTCGTTYSFALKASDEVPNKSLISNSPTTTTLPCSDNLGPNIVITSYTNNQIVIISPITVSGTASDSGLGNSGISSVTVNGVAAGGTATGSETGKWSSQSVTLNAGINTITVVAKDASANQNSTLLQISVNYQPLNQAPDSTIVSPAANVTIATGRAVNFQGSGSDPDNNLPLSYAWNFGGGAPNSSAQNPGLVTFNTQGIYTVTFTVMDNLTLSDPIPATRTITVIPPAAVVFVEPSGACNGNTPCFTSIQQAIGVVAAGGTIRVSQSTYRENLLVDSALSFTLEGSWSSNFLSRSNNPALTIIDGDLTEDGVGEGSVFTIQVGNGIHASVTINRFTMQHGNDDEGGGVFAFSANGGTIDLTLTGNVIRQNKSTNTAGGVGIYAQDAGSTANATMTNNMIYGNDSTGDGGGIYAFADNNGQVTLNLVNNTITDNTSTLKGGGLRAIASNGGIAGLTLKNSIVWGNTASVGQDIAIRQESSGSATINASYSDIGDVSADGGAPGTFNDLGNNVDADPLFVNFVGGDLHLASGSPAIDIGTNAGAPTVDFENDPRPQGPGFDLGADERKAPGVSFTPSSLPFGPIPVGKSSADQTVTVRNTGTANLMIGTISLGGTNPDQFERRTDKCSKKTLAPNAPCTVAVRFTPTVIGAKTANLVISSNNPDVNVPLSGTGIGGGPDMTVTPSVLDFKNVKIGKSEQKTVTVKNVGTANLNIDAIGVGGANADQFATVSDQCSNATLAPSKSCKVSVRFGPSVTGGKTATLIIPSNDPDENPVSLRGTGTP